MFFIKRFCWIFPTVIFAVLVILGSLMHPLWGDEAETALFGRSILSHGVPYGWDGVNIMGINDAVVLDKNLINHKSPWAQYYLVAVSFFIFPENSFTARLPFILISILTFPLLYSMVLKLTKSKKIAVVTLLILSLSPAYIMFAYQTRYYALTTLCSIGLTYSIWHLHEKRLWPKIAFVGFAVLFFYSNYVVFVAFLISLITAYVMYLLLHKRRRDARNIILNVLSLGIPIGILTLPWFLIMQPFGGGQGSFSSPQFTTFYISILLQLFYAAISPFINNNGLPLLLIFGYLCMLFFQRKNSQLPMYIFLFLLPFFYFLLMTAITALVEVETAFIHNRYTMNIFPFLVVLVAVFVSYLWQLRKIVAILVLCIYLMTNLFSFQPRSLLMGFVGEIIQPYQTPDKVVADYLKEHAKDGDTAFVSLDRDHEPLIFYLGKKIRFINRITPTNPRVFPENRGILPRYLYNYFGSPDWVILYSKKQNDQSFLLFDMRDEYPLGLSPMVNLKSDYAEIPLNVFFADESRPEIELHSFKREAFHPDERVFIYKKK